jgi:hypothetical protein
MDLLLGEELGKGGFGTVYINKQDPGLCIKLSRKTSSCRSWSNEYTKIKKFMRSIVKYKGFKSFRMVHVVNPTKFVESPDACYMVLPRIFRPDGTTGPTMQAYLDEPSLKHIYPGRGEFIGLEQIRELIPEPDLERACFELGLLLGLIHFIGRNDAYDLEVYIGRERRKRKSRFYLSDQNQTFVKSRGFLRRGTSSRVK